MDAVLALTAACPVPRGSIRTPVPGTGGVAERGPARRVDAAAGGVGIPLPGSGE